MSILDATIVNVAIETLGRSLHTSIETIQWVSTGYLLALGMVIPLTTWVIERFGAKRMWMVSVVIFTAGSLLSGLSTSVIMLIAFRILQGAGGGMIMPIGQTILAQEAGPARMGRVMSAIGIPMLIAPVVGPTLGGLVIQTLSWRWIFFINVPIGIGALLLAWRLLPRDVQQPASRLDLFGFLLLSPGLALLFYSLTEIGSHGGITSPAQGAILIIGIALILGFIIHALGRDRALLDLRLFADRNFTAANCTTFLLSGALFGGLFILPLYYQVVRGASPLVAGLLLAPQELGAMAAMSVAGRLTDRFGPGWIIVSGATVVVIGTIPFTQVSPTTNDMLLAGSLFVRGIGLGSTLMPAMAASYRTLRRDEVARATPLLSIVNRLGASLGTATLAVVLAQGIRQAVPGQAAGLSPVASQQASSTTLGPIGNAFAHTFWWSLIMSAVALVPALCLPRKPSAGFSPSDESQPARSLSGSPGQSEITYP
jgi:EmrB/QacA subfamily drug resistance transporter